jgi:hypothetical protein
MLDALPSVARYLEKLPAGLASYPECLVKASVLRNSADPRVLGPEVPLPPEVRALLDHPPPVSVWVPEVHYTVIQLATHEVHFPGPDPQAFITWVHARNVQLLSTPLYRALFLVLSPERVLLGLEKRWGSFRRGTQLQVLRADSRTADLLLRTPPNLYAQVSVWAMGAALRAGMVAAGAKPARLEGELRGTDEIRFHAIWT